MELTRNSIIHGLVVIYLAFCAPVVVLGVKSDVYVIRSNYFALLNIKQI